ncbi:hypothetical protein A2U01_0015614, partial [Trifolium medium]|nr:hypothetical protein [Trifolium medium]
MERSKERISYNSTHCVTTLHEVRLLEDVFDRVVGLNHHHMSLK